MTNEKYNAKDIPKFLNKIYNDGKYGKINDEDINDNLKGYRVVSDEFFGTIKFVGNIPGSTGFWLGVDWDDESRGRNDGSFNGIRYFDSCFPKSGSFVRPIKVSLGLTVEEAIEMRYGNKENEESQYVLDEFFLESSDSDGECGTSISGPGKMGFRSHQKVKVNFSGSITSAVGAGNCQMDRLKAAVLHSLPVFRCQTPCETGGKLNQMVPVLEELDLAQTLISDWVEVAKICIQLPRLKHLNVSDNKFQTHSLTSPNAKQFLTSAFPAISYLVLVRIYFSWQQFWQLFDYFPNLEHLCLAYNKLSSIVPAVHPNFNSLTYLDLACNDIDDFETDILPLGCLLKLETLLLNDNKIEKIVLPGQLQEQSDQFPSLSLIAVSNNQISSWQSLHHLARLRSLKELIFMFNPILECQKNQETARQDVIAKVPKIKVLNRNEIKYEERKGAEIDYLKRYGKMWLECQPCTEDTGESRLVKSENLARFVEEHPRFLDLIELYGAPEQSEMKEVSHKLKERLIEVVFQYPDSNGGWKLLNKKIPRHMTIHHIRSLLRRLCRISNQSEFSLCYVNNCRPDLEIPLEANTREIGFYDVENGDRIIVHLCES